MMKKDNKVSVLVYMKKKFAYGRREEQMEVLAHALKGKFVGGGTNLCNGKRDQQYYFKNRETANTFLEYPTVKEAILSEIDIVEV
jgi:hypothetical protein